MPVGDQIELPARLQMLAALFEQVPTGKIVHRMLQVKGRVAQDQLRGLFAVLQETVTLVKADYSLPLAERFDLH